MMKPLFRSLRVPSYLAATLFGASCAVSAQTSVIPIPFASTVVGIAAGSGNTACTTGIANQFGVSLGDGCPATQAALLALYDTQVDAAGNVYTSENGTNVDIRVLYRGGANFANVLKAANGGSSSFSPIVGRIYTFAGGTASALTAVSKVYYCGNITGGQQALDSLGDGCPAAQSYIKPRGIAIDKYGNVYTTSNGGGDFIRVIYAGGTQVANLIALETPGTTAQVGYIYKIAGSTTTGYSGDGGLASAAKFSQLRYLTVDSNGNIYASDGNTQSGTSPNIYEIAANNVRRIDGTTGIITTFAGQNSCTYSTTTGCPYGTSADGVAAAGALLSGPYALFVDASNNVYIADYYNSKIRVVYEGGTIAGISNPIVGDIYTYAGGGTSTSNGTLAAQVKFNQLYIAGIDNAGNIYAEDGTSKLIWKFDAATSYGNVIAAGPSTTTVAKSGSFCSGSAGPKSTDNFGDGCPGIQANFSDTGHVAFDLQGNLYLAENGNAIVRELSYNNLFAPTTDGTTVSQPLAFESTIATALNSENFTLEGGATSEYSDGGSDTCAAGSLAASTLCVFNVSFTPAHAGQRQGSVQLNLSTTATPPASATVTEDLSGTGIASDIAIDAGTQSTLGTKLSPVGLATDLLGNVYVSDATGNQVLAGVATGTTLSPVITNLNKPAQIAIDGIGNLYVADTANNRVLETTKAGVTITTLGTGLAAPKGIAVDGLGDIYIADTGNNRVLQVFANGTQNVLPLSNISAPTQLAVDAAGNLFILNSGNSNVVEYSSGTQSTVALDAAVKPVGIALDPAGDLYVADSAGQKVLVYSPGVSIGTVLFTGLTTPVGLAVDADANLFIADSGLSGVLELRRSMGNIAFPVTNVPGTSNANISITNVGNAALSFPTSTLYTQAGSTLFTAASSTTNGCATGTTYSAGTGCGFTATFAPTATGSANATLTFNTNATNTNAATALLSGTGLLLTSTTTALTVNPQPPIYYGNTVTLTAKMTPVTTTTAPGGNFTFVVNGVTQYPSPAVGNGTVQLQLTNLGAGSDSASATYSGDGTVYASSAASANFTVNQAITKTAFTITPVNSAGALSLTFQAVVSSTTATGPTGTVTFYVGGTSGTVIGSVVLVSSANGVATLIPNPAMLSYNPNNFIAVYSGDTNFAGSTSPAVIPVGDFILGYSSPSVSISQGGVGNLTVQVASLYGGSGTVTPSCTGMPANSVCRFLPQSFTVGTTSENEPILFYTNVQSSALSNEQPWSMNNIVFALGLPIGLAHLFTRRRSKVAMLAMLTVGIVFCTSLVGCGNGYNASTASKGLVTPSGTYTVNVIFTGSNGLTTTHTLPVTLTVIADSGSF